MAEAWKKLKDKVKAKRTKTSLPETQRRPRGDELTVQRLSAQVSGKAQSTVAWDLANSFLFQRIWILISRI